MLGSSLNFESPLFHNVAVGNDLSQGLGSYRHRGREVVPRSLVKTIGGCCLAAFLQVPPLTLRALLDDDYMITRPIGGLLVPSYCDHQYHHRHTVDGTTIIVDKKQNNLSLSTSSWFAHPCCHRLVPYPTELPDSIFTMSDGLRQTQQGFVQVLMVGQLQGSSVSQGLDGPNSHSVPRFDGDES